MSLLNFKHGLQKNLTLSTTPLSVGTVYVTRDERAMYVDLPEYNDENGNHEAAKRIRIGDLRIYDYLEDLTAEITSDITGLNKTALYYAQYDSRAEGNQINALLKWGFDKRENKEKFIQLNTTSDLAANLAALEGRISTAETNIITLQGKVETLNGNSTTAGSVDYKIAAAVVDLNTVINTKANQSDLNDLIGTVTENKQTIEARVNSNAEDIKGLQDLVGSESVATQISAAAAELNETINTKANQSDLNDLIGTVAENKRVIEARVGAVEERVSNNEKDIKSLQGLVGSDSVADQISTAISTKANQSDLNELIGTVADNKQTIEARVSAVENNYLKSDDAAETYLTKLDAGNTYATKDELDAAESDLLGTSADSEIATIHGALNKAKEVDTKLTETNNTLINLSKEVADYKTSNDRALAAVKTTADAAATNADLQAEITRAKGAEGDLLEAINTETANRQTDIAGLDTRLDVVEVFLTSVDNDTEIIDTLKEIQDYIRNDETGAADMAASIQGNTNEIERIENTLISDYATKEELNTEATNRQNAVNDTIDYIDTKLTWTQF